MLKRFILPVCLSLAAISPALADELVPVGTSGAWGIFRDPTHENGCLTQAALSDGTFLRMGFDKKGSRTGYIASFNPAWSTVEVGKKYDVVVTFGNQSFTGEGTGVTLKGDGTTTKDIPGITAKATNVDLLLALAKEEKVNLSVGGPGIDVALKGSNDALKMALECQAQ
jgi:hypothetical protein